MSSSFGPPLIDFAGQIGGVGDAFSNAYGAAKKTASRERIAERMKDPNADFQVLAADAVADGHTDLAASLLDMAKVRASAAADANAAADLGGIATGRPVGGSALTTLGGSVAQPSASPSPGMGTDGAGKPVGSPFPSKGTALARLGGVEKPSSLADMATSAGLTASYLPAVRQIESGGDDQAVSPTGARGPFQFTGPTARQYGLTDPNDLNASADATARLARDNAGALRQRLGRDPTEGEIYLAHQQGAGGASALLSNPNMPAVDALAPAYGGNRAKAARAIQVNGGDPNMPARDFAELWTGKYDRIANAGRPGAEVTERGNLLARAPGQVQSAEVASGMVNPDGSYPAIESIATSRRQAAAPAGSSSADEDAIAVPVKPGRGTPATWQTPGEVPDYAKRGLSKASIPVLVKHLASPIGPGMREVTKMFLATALNDPENKAPESVKEWQWARANGETTLGYIAFKDRNAKEKDDDGEKIDKQIAARQRGATTVGLDPNSPEGKRYIATGTMPSARDTPMSASDRKSIQDADDAVVSAQNAISAMGEAKRLSAQAYDGPTASYRGKLTGMFGSDAGQSTTELNNVVTSNALGQLKSIFGGNPTEGERKILLEIQGSADQPQAVRDRIFDRASALAQRRLETATAKAAELRGGTYYKEGGGPTGKQQGRMPGGGASARDPQATKGDPGSRFNDLVGSGLSKQDAYAKMAEEGY